MSPREPSTAWVGDYPSTYSFIERSGNIIQNLTFRERQRLQTTERRRAATERVASRPPLGPTWEDRPAPVIPAHLRQYTGRILRRPNESFFQYLTRLERRHNQPVRPGERFGRPMR